MLVIGLGLVANPRLLLQSRKIRPESIKPLLLLRHRQNMDERNTYFRQLHLQDVPSTNGIPNFYLSSVRMFRAALPTGLTIDSRDYNATCAFLASEGFPYRAIAQILDFSFNLGYVDVLNAPGIIGDDTFRRAEIQRMKDLLAPHGLEAWRKETKEE